MTEDAPRVNSQQRLRVLFVTRKWRPATGGMENYSHELTTELAEVCDLTVRALPGRDNGMPPSIASLALFFFGSMIHLASNSHRFDVIHIGDLALWPLAIAGRIRSRTAKLIISVHGTDVAYPLRRGLRPRLYGAFLTLGAALCSSVRVIANSAATAAKCHARGFTVAATVPLAVKPAEHLATGSTTERYVLFVGRLVRRKGCGWFIREVLPLLDDRIRLKVAGTKWDREETATLNSARVDYLGPVFGARLAQLRQAAIAVIVPNIACDGRDFEGFGLTATEAAGDGGVVVASRLDGLVDAVIDGQTGFLLPPDDAEAYARKINEIAAWTSQDRQIFTGQARALIARHFSWQRVAADTLAVYRGESAAAIS